MENPTKCWDERNDVPFQQRQFLKIRIEINVISHFVRGLSPIFFLIQFRKQWYFQLVPSLAGSIIFI
jgi:hypothetical protein